MEIPAATLSNTARNRALHVAHPYGNYHSKSLFLPRRVELTAATDYYSHRTDDRLAVLPRTLFEGKRVLDLGCNAGAISFEIRELGAKEVLGIDIDEVLIQKARGVMGAVERVEFVQGDFMQPAYFEQLFHFRTPGEDTTTLEEDATAQDTPTKRERPETILLLSITKWLHLHHHDSGLLHLFQTLYALLPSSGTLIIEPQEWANYARATKKNKELREVYKGLLIRPDFVEELVAVGLRLVGKVERVEGGFSRPLYEWRKDCTSSLFALVNLLLIPHYPAARITSSRTCVRSLEWMGEGNEIRLHNYHIVPAWHSIASQSLYFLPLRIPRAPSHEKARIPQILVKIPFVPDQVIHDEFRNYRRYSRLHSLRINRSRRRGGLCESEIGPEPRSRSWVRFPSWIVGG